MTRNDARPDGGSTSPAVSPAVYDEHYYRNWCAGFEEWNRSGGQTYSGLYAGALAKAGLAPGEVIVDFGTGRSELLVEALKLGARRAIGIDYSADAVRLAQTTLRAADAAERAVALVADVRRTPLPSGCADLVTMLDIVEHLTPPELHDALIEARRILRPGGRLFAHTLPTRTIYEVTYRLQRGLVPSRRRQWPADPRVELERVMHVNEQTRLGLLRALRKAGFADARVDRGEWVHDTFVPDERAKRLYRRLAAHRLTRPFGIADLWARATRQ
jgi:SAM-dependent methyltransferase